MLRVHFHIHRRPTKDHTRRKVAIKTKTNADMRNSAAPAIPRNVLRFQNRTVKLFTTKNAPKSLRRIAAPPTLRNAPRLQNKSVKLFMIKSVKKYPRTTAKKKRSVKLRMKKSANLPTMVTIRTARMFPNRSVNTRRNVPPPTLTNVEMSLGSSAVRPMSNPVRTYQNKSALLATKKSANLFPERNVRQTTVKSVRMFRRRLARRLKTVRRSINFKKIQELGPIVKYNALAS